MNEARVACRAGGFPPGSSRRAARASLPELVPPSPYPHVSGLRPGELLECWVPDWQLLERLLAHWAHFPFRHVRASANPAEGSVPGGHGVRSGLDYWVVSGESPWLFGVAAWAKQLLLPSLCQKLGVELVPLAAPEQRQNLNLLSPTQDDGTTAGGYEWHYDPCPVTAVVFLTEHEDEGAFLFRDPRGELRRIEPRPGRLVVGDLSQTLHAVEPFSRSPFRLTLPLGFGVPGHTGAAGSEYLYG